MRGRRLAEKGMTASLVVRRPTGKLIENPDWTVSPEYLVIYEGKGKITTYEAHETTVVAGEATHVVQRSSAHFPVGSLAPLPGDVVTVLAEPVDPLLVGRSFRIVQQYPTRSHATAYRVFIDDNVGEDVPPYEP